MTRLRLPRRLLVVTGDISLKLLIPIVLPSSKASLDLSPTLDLRSGSTDPGQVARAMTKSDNGFVLEKVAQHRKISQSWKVADLILKILLSSTMVE